MSNKMPNNPRLEDVITWAIDTSMSGRFIALPGRVMKYDATNQTADIKPSIQHNTLTASGKILVMPVPVLQAIPVMFPRGGGYYISFPLAKGDKVLLVFCDRNIDQYNRQSTGDQDVDPLDLEYMGLNGAIAIPGFYPEIQKLPKNNADTQHMMLGGEGDAIKLRFEDAVVKLEQAVSSANRSVAIAEELKALWDDFSERYDRHIHPTSMGPSGAPTEIGTALLFDSAKIASTKLKLPGNS